MTKTARDIMSPDAQVVEAGETLADAARKMREQDIGSLPVLDSDGRLHGLVTQRDIVVGCVAIGRDPAAVAVEELAGERTITIGADDPIEEVVTTMAQHGVRRLPVVEGETLVGMVTQTDVARNLAEHEVEDFVKVVSNEPLVPDEELPAPPTSDR